MNTFKILTLGVIAMVLFDASADRIRQDDISVEIVDYRGRVLPTFDANPYSRKRDKAYVQAEPGQQYGIRVTNHSNERLAFVIAVDGRNIISGRRADLDSKERKYVLGPYQSAIYRGWRSSRNHINEFYFTDDIDSYSAAFGDYSAMGVIAVAVFRERYRYDDDVYHESRKRSGRSESKRHGTYESAPGTGYGDERYSRSRKVDFEPERRATATYLFKYEWRQTLCEKGITRCYGKRNRLWDDDRRYARRGYAPAPPAYRSFSRRYRP
ncbi:MAG: hypothetical protein AAF465_11095 [Pseudomonadota bacterium]